MTHKPSIQKVPSLSLSPRSLSNYSDVILSEAVILRSGATKDLISNEVDPSLSLRMTPSVSDSSPTAQNDTRIRFVVLILVLLGYSLARPLSVISAENTEIFQEITVHPGETLWDIANKYLKDPRRWPDIVKYNSLKTSDPTVALPGTKVKIPILLVKEEYRNAELIKFIPEVRYKRKGQEEWQEAKPDLTLHYEDSLRTMKGAQAHVRFPSKEVVQINENTYVVLKPEKILQEIELLQGEVRASRAKVIMPHGTVVEPKGPRSDYQAKIREDQTEVVFVYKGRVDVTAQGKTVTVREGFGTEVPKFSAPKEPMALSQFKDFIPTELAMPAEPLKKERVEQAKVDAAKNELDPSKLGKSKSISSEKILISYSVQLAADEKFARIIYEKTQPTGTFFDIKKINIPDGNYYMKVAFTDALGIKGAFSEPSMIVKDTVPPVISNLFPKDNQRFSATESFCDVIGEVQGATLVAVNDEVVFIGPTGRFNKFVNLEEGKNLIAVIARDVNGNETVENITIYYSKGK